MGDSKREFFPAPGKSTCPRKLSVPHRVQGYRITDPVALPVRGPTLSWLTPWAYHRITATIELSLSGMRQRPIKSHGSEPTPKKARCLIPTVKTYFALKAFFISKGTRSLIM